MSSIDFTFANQTRISVSRRERCRIGVITKEIFVGLLMHGGSMDDVSDHLFGELMNMKDFSIKWGYEIDTFELDGKRYNVFDCMIETCRAIGSEALSVAARIHGFCELHCYVRNEHFVWFAGVLDRCKEELLFCAGDDLLDELRRNMSSAVVLSFSGCNGFPSRPDANEEAECWYDLPFEERWKAAFDELPEWLELAPDLEFSCSNGISALQIAERCRQAKSSR